MWIHPEETYTRSMWRCSHCVIIKVGQVTAFMSGPGVSKCNQAVWMPRTTRTWPAWLESRRISFHLSTRCLLNSAQLKFNYTVATYTLGNQRLSRCYDCTAQSDNKSLNLLYWSPFTSHVLSKPSVGCISDTKFKSPTQLLPMWGDCLHHLSPCHKYSERLT